MNTKKIKEQYLEELKDILSDCSIEWSDSYLDYKDYSPSFNFGQEDDARWFYIVLGKYIAIEEYLD